MKHRQTFAAYVTAPWRVQDGKLIAPVVIAVEGVHVGSMGAIYWAGHILKQSVSQWENIPVVVNHPQINGRYVSVQETPNEVIGIVTRPHYDSAKKALKAEIEIPINHPRVSEIQQAREVSMGIFSTERYESGTWNGESYHACAIGMEPDHLAILPGPWARGACSFSDGCGLRTNSAADEIREILAIGITNYINNLNEKGGSIMDHEVEPLLPPGIGRQKRETDHSKAQRDAEAREFYFRQE